MEYMQQEGAAGYNMSNIIPEDIARRLIKAHDEGRIIRGIWKIPILMEDYMDLRLNGLKNQKPKNQIN